MISQGFIFVHYYGGTYIARYCNKTASCTSGKKQAAEKVARKIMGDRPHIVKAIGTEYVWEVLIEEK